MSGRRLRVRVSIGLLLVAIVVAICAWDAGARFRIGSLLAAALGTLALWEYSRMVAPGGLRGPVLAALGAGSVALFWRSAAEIAGSTGPPDGFFCIVFGLACAFPFLAAIARRRTTPVGPEDLQDLAAALLGLLVVVFPVLSLIEIGYLVPGKAFLPRTCTFFSSGPARITENEVGPWLLLATIFTSKLNDIGGYLVGSWVGRIRLAPGISPKKSVEGSVAGLVLGVLAALAAFTWFCPTAGVLTPGRAIAFGVVVSLASQAGDLCESLIKRAVGVKDSAALIPAFGGMLDVLDSFILAAPAGYTLLWLWSA